MVVCPVIFTQKALTYETHKACPCSAQPITTYWANRLLPNESPLTAGFPLRADPSRQTMVRIWRIDRYFEPSDCGTAGVARSESKFGGTDILIDVGLSIVGGVLGTAACNSISDRGDYAACLSAFSTAVPLLLTPLSVEYECAAEPARDVASTPARNHTWTSKTQTAQAALPEIPTPLAEVPSPEVASPLLVNATAPGQ